MELALSNTVRKEDWNAPSNTSRKEREVGTSWAKGAVTTKPCPLPHLARLDQEELVACIVLDHNGGVGWEGDHHKALAQLQQLVLLQGVEERHTLQEGHLGGL